MSEPKMQHCDFCGEEMGIFKWSRRFDGPLNCGSPECERDEREQERQADEEARAAAEQDDYGAYRGRGW